MVPVLPGPAVMPKNEPNSTTALAAGVVQTQALPLYCSTCPLLQLLLASLAAVTAALAICAVPMVPVKFAVGNVAVLMAPVICEPATLAVAANDSVLAERTAYGLAARGCRGVISGSAPIVMPRVY